MNKLCPLCGGTGVYLPAMSACPCQHRDLVDWQQVKRDMFSQLQQWRLVQILRSLMWWVPK